MPLLPVSTVRTSTPLATQRLLFQLNADQLELQRHYDQLSTGRRVLRMADDPSASGRALGLYRGIDRGQQLARNARSTISFYQSADDALARVDGALIEARGVAVHAAQTVLSEDERVSLSYTLQQTIQSVFAAGNTLYRDHQLLGGFLDSGPAFRYDGNDIVYLGKNAVGLTEIGAGKPTEINVNGDEGLGSSEIFLSGERLEAAVDRESRLIDLREGKGVARGAIRLSSGSGWTDLDLRSASTLGDVVDLISNVVLDGRKLAASLTSDGIRVEYADGLTGTLAIADAEGSSTAKDLAISNPQGLAPPPLIGDGLTPRITHATKIENLNNGSGINLNGGIQITQGDQTFVVDLDQAQTVGDVVIAINRSGADIRAELNQAEGRIEIRALRSGVDYGIGENGGDAASQLGIRSATGNTRLSDLGRGAGLQLNSSGPDLLIDRPDGVVLEIDLDGAETIQDVIQLIRNHPLNQDVKRILVDLNDVGNGLQLKAPPGANSLTVRQPGGSDAGVRLGLIPVGSSQAVGSVNGSADTIVGVDYRPREAGGALDTLLRLQRAVLDSDQPEIARLQQRLDLDLDRASRSRGRVGVWANNLEQLQAVTEDQVVRLQSQLSDELDADLATIISEMSQRQLALEASMRIIGETAQLTVLNFL